jgi:molybdopterin converting factor small subunit
MAAVWIPALLREITGGQERVSVPGATVGEVIEALDKRYPGIRARLVENDRLRPSLAVAVDGEISRLKLLHRLGPDSEVVFLPSISGG